MFQPLDLSGDFTASIDPSGTRPLARYSDDELLAASDCVFGKLDDPATGAPSELLARYDDISLELARREVGREPPGNPAASLARQRPPASWVHSAGSCSGSAVATVEVCRVRPGANAGRGPGTAEARLLQHAAELERFSRRNFLIGTGAASLLAADMLFTRHVQDERRVNKILTVARRLRGELLPARQLDPLSRATRPAGRKRSGSSTRCAVR